MLLTEKKRAGNLPYPLHTGRNKGLSYLSGHSKKGLPYRRHSFVLYLEYGPERGSNPQEIHWKSDKPFSKPEIQGYPGKGKHPHD